MKWVVGLTLLIVLGALIILKPKPSAAVLGSKIINLGKVEVSATPITVKTSEPIVVKLALTTHSVELNYDFTQVVKAMDERGNSYPAVNWSGGAGGHHLEGELTFGPLLAGAKQLKLIFTGIDQEGGELLWQL